MNLRLTSSMILLLCGLANAGLANTELVRVWPGYRDAASFTAVTEYFGGSGSKANRTARRTDPARREGYYWLIRAQSDEAVPRAVVRLEVIRSGATEPQVHEFSTPLQAGSHALSVGLTGDDWVDPGEVPVAWRVSLISPAGDLLATSTSFLWQNATP